jgi:hypothetical protein
MKTGSWKKRLFTCFIFLLGLYVLWLGTILLRQRARREIPAAKRPSTHEVQGVYHIHTTFSDGRQPLEKVVAAASRQHLDFIILTDHGNPNRASLAGQGWKENVLVLAGSELSVSRGHLVALDFRPPDGTFAQNAEEAVQEVAAEGGFTVIAHPFSKTRWSWGGFTGYAGLEIADSDSMIKQNFWRAIPYLPALLLSPRIFLLKTLERPSQTLRKWDEMAAKQAVYGYFSADAHLAYETLFSCFRLHVLLGEPLAAEFERARAQVFNSLRRGAFYCAVDSARPAGGFIFWAERQRSHFPMGSTVPLAPSSRMQFRAEAAFPFAVQTCLLRDGEVVLRSEGPDISFSSGRPGVYRVEICLRGGSPLARDFPWIISNPIFIREDGL